MTNSNAFWYWRGPKSIPLRVKIRFYAGPAFDAILLAIGYAGLAILIGIAVRMIVLNLFGV